MAVFFRTIAMFVAAMALVGCGREASYRFRMTVEVDSPQGLASGSSVYNVTARKTFRLTSEESAGGGGLRGEAVAVDLPDGPIFVLLKLPDARGSLASVATQALSGDKQLVNVDDYLAAVRALAGWFGGAEAELPRDEWPIMVRFRDLGDPTSVEHVDPEAIGVKRIMLKTTSDDMTTGLVKRLPWLPHQTGSLIRRLSVPDPTNPPIGAMINDMDFSTELGR